MARPGRPAPTEGRASSFFGPDAVPLSHRRVGGYGGADFGSGTSTFTCSTQLTPYQRVNIFGTAGRIEIEIPFNAPPDQASSWTLSAGAFWAARANLLAGNPQKFAPYLKRAALHGRTFYGLITQKALGMKIVADWKLPPIDSKEADLLLVRRTSEQPLPYQGIWRHLTTWNVVEFKGPTVRVP